MSGALFSLTLSASGFCLGTQLLFALTCLFDAALVFTCFSLGGSLSASQFFGFALGGSGSGSVTKLVNNMVAGAYMVVIAEAYAFAAKAGIDLQTTFEATRGGFAGGPVYENKVPKLIKRDYEPGARVAVHRKDILNAKHFAHHMGVDTPMTDVVLRVMDWMNDNGHIDEDQIAMVKYYEDKMDVTVGEEK